MRPRGGNATLGELLGGENQSMSLKNIKDILGEKTPELPRSAVGRFRLIKSLQQRFGNGWRNIPGVNNIVKEFDDDMAFEGTISKMKAIKPKKGDN